MGKTKRTVEEVNVAAASNDSKLITQSKLSRFATNFWARIKDKYDGTFKEVRLSDSTSRDKKLTFTRVSGENPLEIDLRDYARLQDKNDFKQDVSADNVVILNNRHIGTSFEYTSQHRSLGFRGLTTDSFSDGYVDHIRIYMPTDIAPGTNSRWFVWAIKKGANNNKNEDRVVKVIHNSRELSVDSITENSEVKKFVNIPIEDSFGNDTYFIVRCTTHNVEVVKNIESKYREDVVNMSHNQPPLTENSIIDWANGSNVTNANTAVMQLFGRESIGSLSQKINKLNSDSSLYVKQEETTDTGGAAEKAGKVVKLDNTGKLNKNMLPSIAINEYFPIDDFTEDILRNTRYENGDIVVVTNNSSSNYGKKYLCINKDDNATTNLKSAFIELNTKDGSVISINDKSGAVNLTLEAAADQLKLKITGVGGTADVTETSVDIITNEEIDSIIERLQ